MTSTNTQPSQKTKAYTLTIPVSHFLAASVFMSTEETRYYLCGIMIRKTEGGIELCSTCGHRAIIIPLVIEDVPDFEQFIVKSEDVKKIKAVKHHTNMEIIRNETEVILSYAGMAIKGMEIDKTFPDIDRVFPSADRKCNVSGGIGFNPVYLADFVKVNKHISTDKLTPIKMQFGDADSPVLITAPGLYRACVMPMRV